jgi:hypothetical protein
VALVAGQAALDFGEDFISALLSQADHMVQVQLGSKSLIVQGIFFDESGHPLF